MPDLAIQERRGWRPPYVLIAGLALGVVIGLLLIGALPFPGATWLATVFPKYQVCISSAQRNCVIDGDTIRHNGETLWLQDIDAPGVSEYKCLEELVHGKKARARLLDLVNAGPFEVASTADHAVDSFGRQLRTIHRNGQSLGMQLVAEGLAVSWEGQKHQWCE